MSNARDDEWLSAYLDGELDDAETAELETRLARDPTVAAQLDAVLDVVVALRGLDQIPAPEGLEDRVRQRLEEERPEAPVVPLRRRSWSWRALSSVAAAVALIALGSVALVQQLADRSITERAVAARGPEPMIAPDAAAGPGAVLPDEAAARTYFTMQLERLRKDPSGAGASGPCLDVVAPPGGPATVAGVEPVVYEGRPALAYILLGGGEATALLTDPETCRIEADIAL